MLPGGVSNPEVIRPRGHLGATVCKAQRARADGFPGIQLESLISLPEKKSFQVLFLQNEISLPSKSASLLRSAKHVLTRENTETISPGQMDVYKRRFFWVEWVQCPITHPLPQLWVPMSQAMCLTGAPSTAPSSAIWELCIKWGLHACSAYFAFQKLYHFIFWL